MNIAWNALIFVVVFVILVSLIGIMLFSIARRGDERSRFIKLKATSTTFVWTVVILGIETVRTLIDSNDTGSNPFFMLVLVSFVFLVSLLVYKRKYGDIG